MTLAVSDMFTAKVSALAETGELPEIGKVWFNPKPIRYSSLIEVNKRPGYEVADFITVKNGVHIVAEIVELDTPNGKRFFRTA